MRIIFFLLSLIFILFSKNLYAENCIKANEQCIDYSTKKIDGVSRTECWEYRTEYKCYENNFTDYCLGISSINGCHKIGSECVNNVQGSCVRYKDKYQCGNPDLATGKILKIDTTHTITNEYWDENSCNNLLNQNKDKTCTLIKDKCISKNNSKLIDGKLEVNRDCFEREKEYFCKGEIKYDDCEGLIKEPSCTYKYKQCIANSYDNECIHNELFYDCREIKKGEDLGVSCNSQVYCVDGNCNENNEKQKGNFLRAIANLAAINESGKGVSEENLTVFKGTKSECAKSVGGFKNCCIDDGWGQDASLTGCNYEETNLAKLVTEKVCHYVGTYCSQKTPIGVCLQKSKSYCCFESKISRIFQEQARLQKNISWGSGGRPNCRGLTIEEFQTLDMDKMDFSEFEEDVNEKMRQIPNEYELKEDIQNSSGWEESY